MRNLDRTFSVAPMMDWTDRHCRFLHRLLSKHTLLYTEMVTAPAVIHGDHERLLEFDEAEHPLALQLGGSDPAQLEKATRLGCDYGYDEINLNVGCPSDRVQSGQFGACLMQQPELVADCVQAMCEGSSGAEVTVKCRIGVDDQVPSDILPIFLETVSARGVQSFIIHARMAWLNGLSPKENRDIPPLDYDLVHRMKADFLPLDIVINGGIDSLHQAKDHLARGLDGVMIGRSAYHRPVDILASVDKLLFRTDEVKTAEDVVLQMLPYIEQQLSQGKRLNQITRHMLGLFAGRPGARQWRRTLSERAHTNDAGPEVVEAALACVRPMVVV